MSKSTITTTAQTSSSVKLWDSFFEEANSYQFDANIKQYPYPTFKSYNKSRVGKLFLPIETLHERYEEDLKRERSETIPPDSSSRSFVPYLVENDFASEIRVLDKVLLVTAALNLKQQEAFSQVEDWQKDLVDRVSIEKSFTRADGSSYDYVFNLAAEAKYSQIEKETARRNVKVFVEMSTAEIYQADKNPSKENDKAKPWTMFYGSGATMGLTPRIVCGRIYKLLDEEMKVLWSKDLKINTVHALEVVRALWHVATWYQNNDKAGKGTSIYNLADLGNTDQERINKYLSNIFGIKTGFYGTITSNLA
ncbi:1646_t:CDS:10 [Scutellospora calospora]|uniref:1646_t:CDS:1 n=1 Tax=Scutellospora calospora TaxID=85575 RepID=A0ACA9K643_9GLOM|nr:1646_t:CDS:10 [Scutellospora calospora]